METVITYLNLLLNIATLGFCLFIIKKLDVIKYMLELPAVKKMGSKIKVKPYKADGKKTEGASKSSPSRPSRPSRDSSRGSSRSGERTDRDRSDKNGGRPNRNARTRNGRPSLSSKDSIMSNQAAEKPVVKSDETPSQASSSVAKEKPVSAATETQPKGRRPLKPRTATVETPKNSSESTTQEDKKASVDNNLPATPKEAVQHGRRTKVKKAPTFED